MPTPVDLAALEVGDLETLVADWGEARFHARQIHRWIHARGVADPAQMTDLPGRLRDRMREAATVATPEVVADDCSEDGTRKLVLGLADGRRIEAVYIPDTPKQTFCISTQVGCAMGCGFCLTGKMGLVRHLTAGEICGQVRVLAGATGLLGKPFNLVLMGMGEPLHNYDATMQAFRMLTGPHGMALPARRITLSTVGIVPAMDRLAAEPAIPNLAVSLHATTDQQRTALVPPNQKYPLAEILDACRRFPLSRRDRITFEYVLLDGVNDSVADARRLAALVEGIQAKVNVIPLNPAPGIPYGRPPDAAIDRFARTLSERGVRVSVRKSRGRDIRAACGQLIVDDGPGRSTGQQIAELLS